jgi:hypothetical protein
MGEAMKKMGEALGAATGKKVTPVDFRELKALLPEALPGMKRTRAEGERAAAMGINISKAEGEYQKEGSSVHINLMDMGTLSGMAAMATVGWAMAEIDKETETGYEKNLHLPRVQVSREYNRNEQGWRSYRPGGRSFRGRSPWQQFANGRNYGCSRDRRPRQARCHEGKGR